MPCEIVLATLDSIVAVIHRAYHDDLLLACDRMCHALVAELVGTKTEGSVTPFAEESTVVNAGDVVPEFRGSGKGLRTCSTVMLASEDGCGLLVLSEISAMTAIFNPSSEKWMVSSGRRRI